MKTLFLAAVLALATLVHAQDYDTFVGVEVGNTKLIFDQMDSQRGSEYGVRLGFIRDTGRVCLSANKTALKETDLNSLSVNFDAITPNSYRFNDSFSLRAFIGVHGGFVEAKADNFADDEGAIGGAEAGIFLDFPANISIEVGYRATWADIEFGTEPVKNYQTAYAAYNYTF